MRHEGQFELRRREFLQLATAGVAATSMTGWLPVLAARAAEERAAAKACIVLWMDGGPPHTDTFDLKPEVAECGIFKPISTAVPGIQISELLPEFAGIIDRAAILRSMKTEENEHLRARVHLRTGYKDSQGGVSHPSLGSIASAEIGDPAFPIPSYVAIADRRDRSHGPGYLGTRHQPLYVHDPAKGVENLQGPVPATQFDARLGLLADLEQGFARSYRASISQQHHTIYGQAVEMMRSEKSRAFDLSQEPESVRAKYGDSRFGKGCLMARRLIEAGVKYVEVGLGGWDTHFENNDAIRKLCGTLDPVMTTLVTDLEERGLLESTLIVWMGEFGRTPKFKNKGRDHYAKAWTTVLMGGGVRGGQVIGSTNAVGAEVEERPISVADFMATICHGLGIDYAQEHELPDGRPLSLTVKGAQPVLEAFS